MLTIEKEKMRVVIKTLKENKEEKRKLIKSIDKINSLIDELRECELGGFTKYEIVVDDDYSGVMSSHFKNKDY